MDYGLKKKQMGGAKRQIEEYYSWLSEQAEQEQAAYEEAQTRLRLSMTCKDLRRNLSYSLMNRIIELSIICS